jgi:hypothetical protein
LFAQRTRIPTSARSIGFCAIWVCISSSSNTLTTTGNATIGGVIIAPNQPCFKLKCNNTTTSSSGTNINYNGVVIDNYSAYDINARQYVVPVAGNWFFLMVFNQIMYLFKLRYNKMVLSVTSVK